MRSLPRFLSTIAVAGVVAIAGAAPSVAQADPLTAQDEANARFQTGLKYYDARDFESARLAFTQAYAVLQKPGILLNLALSELYSNRAVDALGHFEQYLKDAAPPPDKRERAQKAMQEAYERTGHVAIKSAPGAEVRIDDKPLASIAPVVHVTPGTHAVSARLGDKSKTVSVEAHVSETVTADVTFDADAAPPSKSPASSAALSGAAVDGPPREPRGETFWGFRSVTGLALLGVGAIGLGIGFAAKGTESSEGDRVTALGAQLPADACSRSASPQCTELASAVDARDSAASRASTFLAIGGVAAGAGALLVVSAIVWPHRRSASTALAPMVGPHQAGLFFRSDF
jgi:hypothetical protein